MIKILKIPTPQKKKKKNIDINNNVLDLNDNPRHYLNEKMNENEIDNEENDINTNDIKTITHINERNEDKINNYNYPKNKSNSKYLQIYNLIIYR